MILSQTYVDALRTFQDKWGEENVVLIGATALTLFLDMRWRTTADLDLTVAANERAVFDPSHLPQGWHRDEHQEQRLHGPGDTILDVLPASQELLAAGRVRWPSGFGMNLAGLRLAFAHNVRAEAAPGFQLRVAPPEVIAVLKIVAYLDRPHARPDDLIDLAYILEERVSGDDEERYAPEVIERHLDYEEAGPFVVGRRIGAIINQTEEERLREFLDRALDPRDSHGIRQRLLARGPFSSRAGDEEVHRRLSAFALGVDDG